MPNRHYTYRVTWSAEDGEFVATCAEFPSLSWIDADEIEAIRGIRGVVAETVEDLRATGEAIPDSIADRKHLPQESLSKPWWWFGQRDPIPMFTLCLAAFTFLLVLVGFFQWSILSKTDETLRTGQRAFVGAVVELTPTRDPTKSTIDLWRVRVVLENSGNSEATNIKWRIGGGIDILPNPENQEVDIQYGDSGSGVLLPKGRLQVIDSIIQRSKIAEIIKGQGAYFLGTVTYEDAFQQSHITKFCAHIYGGPWNNTLPATSIDTVIDRIDLGFNMCRHNNCADHGCK